MWCCYMYLQNTFMQTSYGTNAQQGLLYGLTLSWWSGEYQGVVSHGCQKNITISKRKLIGGENHWPVASHWRTLSHNVVNLYQVQLAMSRIQNQNFSADSHWRVVVNPFYYYTPAPPEGDILFYLCPSVPRYFLSHFSQQLLKAGNLIFGHKLHIHVGMPYCGKRFWIRQIPTSCLLTSLVFIHIEHICGGIISEH